MNNYEITISGKLRPIHARASRAGVALNRALSRFSDSQFLNTRITIKLVGPVPKVFHVRGTQVSEDGRTRSFVTITRNLPTRTAAVAEQTRIDNEQPGRYVCTFIVSGLAEETTYKP